MEPRPVEFCVVSHTHWDREWYLTFQEFRVRLVQLVDRLLRLLDEQKAFRFHLDGQTVILDDYLEIKPQMREALAGHVRAGRLLVGPWYVLTDFFLAGGESAVRNLLIGMRAADSFGACARVGYMPDQFGLPSQLPQILRGFGIEGCVFGRGYTQFQDGGGGRAVRQNPVELEWEGADGSVLFACHLAAWYNNAQRFPADRQKSLRLLLKIRDELGERTFSPYLLCMNGVDHLEAQEDLLPILADLNGLLPAGMRVYQTTLPEHLHRAAAYFEEHGARPHRVRGELREGAEYDILKNTLSSRVYLKQQNAEAQSLVEARLEPLYSMIALAGAAGEYPQALIGYLWRRILQNQAHDSICGCAADAVHGHMEDRYREIQECGSLLLEDGLEWLGGHLRRDRRSPHEHLLLAVNTTEGRRSEVVEAQVQLPVGEGWRSFSIAAADGRPVPFAVLRRERLERSVLSPVNLPGSVEVDSYRVQLFAAGIPAFGFRAFTVLPSAGDWQVPPGEELPTDGAAGETHVLSNRFLRVEVDGRGRLSLVDRRRDSRLEDLLWFEDTEDVGDAYVFRYGDRPEVVSTRDAVPEVRWVRRTALEQCLEIVYPLLIPQLYDPRRPGRSNRRIPHALRLQVSLYREAPRVDFRYWIDNRARDHRLRAIVRTGIDEPVSHSSAPFDIVPRERRPASSPAHSGDQPTGGLIALTDGRRGVAVFAAGLHEYEHLEAPDGRIALTLLRANESIYRFRLAPDAPNRLWHVPGNQCLRPLSGRFAVQPFRGPVHVLAGRLKAYQNPLLVHCQPVDPRRFREAGPAVPDGEAREWFDPQDPHPAIRLPSTGRFITVAGRRVCVSAVKLAEDGEALILRLFNPGPDGGTAAVWVAPGCREAWQVSLDERPLKRLAVSINGVLRLPLGPKQIVTIAVKAGGSVDDGAATDLD